MAPLSKKSGRGKNWTTPEVTRMLTAVERVLPLGMNEWEAVEGHYNSDLPRAFSFRDWEAIKRKFFLLKNTLKPTGDPTCPPDVAQAKRLYRQIENRAGVEDFGGDENDGDALVRDVSSAPVGDLHSDEDGLMEGTPSAETPEPTTAAATRTVSAPPPTASSPASRTPPAAPSTASKRCGKTPEELSALSSELTRSDKRAAVVISQVAKRRNTIDDLLEGLGDAEGGGDDSVVALVISMEERAAARDDQIRRERAEHEARREEREQRRDQFFLALMAKLVGSDASQSEQ
ncbi:hypothetical protein PF010_g5926 [Phytophthora fragariae]|uniref:DUF6818 domain-containing protein n=1 Tax=Phytophthora fragariae TaxID=53985 RepID=A0A6G0LM72_9STRA|nr:hypothetical protein PF010_g5926 [Phytophthora fragariae]KAE9239254.1 hypothetical protein PF004_g8038 [Phytophthora fragariae]